MAVVMPVRKSALDTLGTSANAKASLMSRIIFISLKFQKVPVFTLKNDECPLPESAVMRHRLTGAASRAINEADDAPAFRAVIAAMLERFGHEIVTDPSAPDLVTTKVG